MSAIREHQLTVDPARRPVALVLGAGGVRGCAHAGVYEVLAAAGLPVDIVVGASTGAIFGLGIAAGRPAELIAHNARNATTDRMFRFYAGRLRTDAGNYIARALTEVGAGKTFADLPRRFAVRVTDMHSGEVRTLAEGPVLPAVQASIALPMIARPVFLNGRWYVDGGLFDTVPVAAAREMGAKTIIAVSLRTTYVVPDPIRRRSWTRTALARLGRQRRPGNGRLLDRTRFGCRLLAASYDPVPNDRRADLTIEPEFGSIGPNALYGGPYCYEAGVRAAREALPDLHRLLGEAVRETA